MLRDDTSAQAMLPSISVSRKIPLKIGRKMDESQLSEQSQESPVTNDMILVASNRSTNQYIEQNQATQTIPSDGTIGII